VRAKRSLFERIRHRARVIWFTRNPSIRIARTALIAPGALLQTLAAGEDSDERIDIGANSQICDGAILASYGGSIAIGANCFVGSYCVLYGHGGLSIGRDTMIAAHTVIAAFDHGFARVDAPMIAQPISRKGIRIGANVWIGAGCRILDGVTIGEGAVVGAGSVVTKDIAAFAVAFGVPAVAVRDRRNSAGLESTQQATPQGGSALGEGL
jgi:acetyltransferase-like isoleucine patch superfamily enzyme